MSSRHLLPGSNAKRAPEQADGWMPGTSPGMTRGAQRRYATIVLSSRVGAAGDRLTPSSPLLALHLAHVLAGVAPLCPGREDQQVGGRHPLRIARHVEFRVGLALLRLHDDDARHRRLGRSLA